MEPEAFNRRGCRIRDRTLAPLVLGGAGLALLLAVLASALGL